jgi:hypothetical protein
MPKNLKKFKWMNVVCLLIFVGISAISKDLPIGFQLKRRLDLIGNLVDAAKKYMEHEKETLMAVTQARSGLLQATQVCICTKAKHTCQNNIWK